MSPFFVTKATITETFKVSVMWLRCAPAAGEGRGVGGRRGEGRGVGGRRGEAGQAGAAPGRHRGEAAGGRGRGGGRPRGRSEAGEG